MDVVRPRTWIDALAAKADHPHLVPISGGTALMVEANAGRLPAGALLDLGRIDEISGWSAHNGHVRLGAALTLSTVAEQLSVLLPGLVQAVRSIGAPPIRNRATLGGNLATGSPRADLYPPLIAAGALVELASVRGIRRVAAKRFITGPHRTSLAPDELIAAVLLPAADGPQRFVKLMRRTGFARAECSFAVAISATHRQVRTGAGVAGLVPRAAATAEEFLAAELTTADLWRSRDPLPGAVLQRFGELTATDVGTAAGDDIRGHMVTVLSRRLLAAAWDGYREGAR